VLAVLIDVGVPFCVIVLMFISGTDIPARSLAALRQSPRALITGSFGQLLITPAVGLAVIHASAPAKPIAACVMLLSICPGGGISNYYTYIARANVALSALITALSTVLALFTIPAWLALFSHAGLAFLGIAQVPATQVLAQLLLFMVLPITAGAILQRRNPEFLERHNQQLRKLSIAVISIVLLLSGISTATQIGAVAQDIAVTSTMFIILAMGAAQTTAIGIPAYERHAVVIEGGVRNIAVALLLGKSLLDTSGLAILAAFLTGYFLIELVIMLGYASIVQKANLAPASR
jgi:BASS family bile acid:Na+ symporter